MPKSSADLPVEFKTQAHEALMSVWWTAIKLKKASRRLFKGRLSSEAQFNVLMLLKDDSEPPTQNDLSRRLLVDKSNITGLLDRLEKQGLIKRTPVASDRRSYHVELTKRGRTLVLELDEMYIRKVREVMQELSEAEAAELIRLTHKVRQGLAQIDTE